jgi:GGDEF domain-containing protein
VLSLVLLELDVLRQLATDEARDAVMADATGRLHEALRTGDIACRLARTTVAVLLPGADAAEARELAARFQAAVASRPVGGARTRLPAAGVATLAPADTPEALVERARQELSGGAA